MEIELNTRSRRNLGPVDWDACLKTLTDGMRTLQLRAAPSVREALIEYLKHLESWNGSYNLTAVRQPPDMVVRHLLDSLAVARFLDGASVADIGTGPGLPGIPLALLRPAKRFTLVESNGKKAAFLRHVVRTLKLPNVAVEQARCEALKPDQRFNTVICRALGTAAEVVRLAGHLCAPRGRIVLMKGRSPEAELTELPPGFMVVESVPVLVPGLDAERHVAVLTPGLL